LEINPEGGPGPAWTEEPVENRKYVTMCSFVHKYQSFAGTCRLRLKTVTFFYAYGSSEMCVPISQATQRHIPQDRRLHPYLYTSFSA